MIRRDQPLPDGSPGWVLVTQPDHASLAGELAAAWGSPAVAPLWPREVVVETVWRHDDGWLEWEASPEIDPEHGRPRSFLEMPHVTAQALWEASIAGVAELGPLAQYLVAMHFVILRRRGASQGGAETDFIAEYSAQSDAWLTQWQALSPENTPRGAARALAHLQLFDALSLWLCCHERPAALDFPTPDGPAVRFFFAKDSWEIEADPWPFRQPFLALSVAGRQVTARQYASVTDLDADAMPVTLGWRIVPSDR